MPSITDVDRVLDSLGRGPLKLAAQGGITAKAGGGQSSATQLVAQYNIITTCATDGDSVVLPNAALPGMEVVVVNKGAKALQVYGLGTDTINDVAAATGVTQMSGSVVSYVCSSTGLWYCEGNGFSGSFTTFSYKDAITAFAGGGQASAVLLTTHFNRVTTVGTAADSVKLPPALPGMFMAVINAAAANSMNVFPSSGEGINALANDAAFAMAANKAALFVCTVAGKWHSILTA